MTEVDDSWKSLYKLGGWVTLILIAYSLATIAILVALGTPPTNAAETFEMMKDNKVIGLLRLDLLTVLVYMPLLYLLLLGLYAALKRTHPVPATVAILLGCAGVTLFLATPSVFSWLALSDKFSVTTNETQKNLLLAAGEAILASDMWHGSGAIMGGVLLQTGALLISVVMLASKSFAKSTAYVGILTHGLDLAHLLVGFIFPIGGVILMAVAGPLYLVWFPLLARDLFKLSRRNSNDS